MRGRRVGAIVLLFALGVLAIAGLRDFARLGDALPWNQLYDFDDFYCAGFALDQRSDPYRYEPLHRCEHIYNSSEAFRRDPARAVPAPLPPYDFPPFMLAARLDFVAARTIDAIAILTAVVAAIAALSLLEIPLDLAALALALPAGYLLLAAGQVVPFALLAIVLCGVALARLRDGAAGVLAAFTLVEPHLGVPVCAAALAWVPRARAPLAVSGGVLAAIAAVTAGPAVVGEYLARVVPAQATAEVGYVYQYGLAYLLHALGSPPRAALIAGDLSYAAMLVLGLWLARRLAATLGRRELLAYLPAAFGVVGGPYVHMVDLAVAIPAALVLATQLRGRARVVAAIALVLLAVPWIDVWIMKKLLLATLFVVAAILLRLRLGAWVAGTTFVAIAVALYLLELRPPPPFPMAPMPAVAAGDLVQCAWSSEVAVLGSADPLWFVVKLPTWLGLGGLVAAALAGLRARRGPAPS
jgi:hypothetical protein